MSSYKKYEEAIDAARELATRCKCNVAVSNNKGDIYGQPWKVRFASRNDSDYARAEIVTPNTPMTLRDAK
jgi:hypothetical protein